MLIRTNGLASVATAAKTIGGVIERMNAIDAALPTVDGVAYFNRLYLKATESVLETMQGTSFEDEAFLESLDVSFADRYFSAFADWERTGSCDQAWRPLFRGRSRPGSAPVQFALAGMNAHINHDLPLALIATSGCAAVRVGAGGVVVGLGRQPAHAFGLRIRPGSDGRLHRRGNLALEPLSLLDSPSARDFALGCRPSQPHPGRRRNRSACHCSDP